MTGCETPSIPTGDDRGCHVVQGVAEEDAKNPSLAKEGGDGSAFHDGFPAREPTRISGWLSSPAGLIRSLYYRPQPLPVALTVLETAEWWSRGWSEPWRRVAGSGIDMILIPSDASGTQSLAAKRRETLADQLRLWIEKAESRVRGA